MTRIGSLADTRLLDWDVDASIYVSLALLRPGSRISPRYLYAYTKSQAFVRGVEDLSLLWAVPKKINMGDIRKVEVRFPKDAREQEAIADALIDAEHSVKSLQSLIAKKQAIKQGMMQHLLTGRTRLPGCVDPWRVAPFEDLASPARERADPRSVSESTRLVELEHIESVSGRLGQAATAHGSVSLKTVFRPGDVLFGKLRAYLRKYWLADSSGVCSTEIWALRAKAGTTSGYLRYLVETERFIEVATVGYGTHMPRSDWGMVRGLEFAVPEVEEQEMIVAILADADREIDALHARLAKAQAIKQGMMQELLTGRTCLPIEEVAS
jgi:type I restriction enzyme S subunit